MTMPDPRHHNTASWIVSLAISITCCSILFVIFAGYISDWKDSLTAMRVRFEAVNERMNEMHGEMELLRHHAAVQQIQILPAPNGAGIQLPISVLPSATPAAPTPAAATPPAAMPATPAVTPPALTPAPAPETPAKH